MLSILKEGHHSSETERERERGREIFIRKLPGFPGLQNVPGTGAGPVTHKAPQESFGASESPCDPQPPPDARRLPSFHRNRPELSDQTSKVGRTSYGDSGNWIIFLFFFSFCLPRRSSIGLRIKVEEWERVSEDRKERISHANTTMEENFFKLTDDQ